MKKVLKVLKVLLFIALTIIFCNSLNVSADTIQIEDSTDYNYYIDLRDNEYKIGRTLIQDGIITTTCSYLPNSYGCGIQVPLTTPFDMVIGKEYTFSFLVATDNRTIQVSTWKSNLNIVSVEDAALNIGGGSKGVMRMYNYDTTENTTYNADVTISLQDSNANIKIYKLDYKIKSKKSQKVKYLTFAFGENFNGDSTTGTLQFSYFMVDASNQEIVDAVNGLKTDLNNINSSITSEETPSFNQDQFLGYLPDNPVSAIINMPINIMNSIIGILDVSSCSPLVLPLPYVGGNITLPCVSTQLKKIGAWNLFDSMCIIICAFWLYRYFIFLYNWVDQTLTLRENTWAGYDEGV